MLRERRLHALGIEPLRLRARDPVAADASTAGGTASSPAPGSVPIVVPTPCIRRLALHPDQAELVDPAIRKMYTALTEAVGKAGLQGVRPCDVADDPTAAVMVFGAAPPPEGVPVARILRAEPLSVLHADRERKRLLWESMQALGRGGSI